MPVTILPLGTSIEFRGLTGKEEDILTDRKKMLTGTAVEEILQSCVTKFGDQDAFTAGDLENLSSADREALLIAIRRETFGDSVACSLSCGNIQCENKWDVEADLSALENKPAPDEPRPFVRKLSTGVTVTFDYLTGKGEKALAKATGSLFTNVMLLRLVSAEGVHPNDRKKWLLELPMRQRQELRDLMAATDCGLETNLTADCPVCGQEASFSAVRQASFFFPTSATSTG